MTTANAPDPTPKASRALARSQPARRLDLLLRSTPGRPAITSGLRAAVATMLPLLVAQTLGLSTGAGSWTSLGGFTCSIADRGGAYRVRAATLGTLAIVGALGVAIAGAAGGHPVAAVAVTFVWVSAMSLARAFGLSAGGVGSSAAIAFSIALASPSPDVAHALARGAYYLAGGAWAMVLSLVLWPLRPYRPLRQAVARSYEALAVYAEQLSSAAERPYDEETLIELDRERRAIRGAIEEARVRVAQAARGGTGETRRGERLLVLVQTADLILGTLIALDDSFETGIAGAGPNGRHTPELQELARVSRGARLVARAVESEPSAAAVVPQLARSPRSGEGEGEADSPPPAEEAAYTALLTGRLDELLMVAAATADAIEDGHPPVLPPGLAALSIGDGGPPWRVTLRASLTLDSLAMRHALRVGLVAAVAVALVRALGLQRGYWVTVTAIIILQPYAGATLIKGLQRVIGTVAGALLTVGFFALLPDRRALLVLIFVLVAVSVSFLRLNYLIYSVFLTPTFVLLAELSAGDWHLAELRVIDTLLGGALGLAGSWLLWPSPERGRFPDLAAAALRAARNRLSLVAQLWSREDEAASVALAEARRAAALASANAEASLDRLLAESPRRASAWEPATTLLTFVRRLVAASTSLSAFRHAPGDIAAEAVRVFLERACTVIDDLASSLEHQRAPAPFTLRAPSAAELRSTVAHAQLERITRQLEVLHGALTRLDAA